MICSVICYVRSGVGDFLFPFFFFNRFEEKVIVETRQRASVSISPAVNPNASLFFDFSSECNDKREKERESVYVCVITQ